MVSDLFKLGSIKIRVTLLTLAIFIIGIWYLSYYVSIKLQQDMTKQIGEQQLSSTALLANQISNDLLERQTTLEKLAEKIGEIGLDNPTQIQSFLDDRFVIKRDYNAGAYVANFDGATIATVPHTIKRIGINFRDRTHITAALDKGKSTISQILPGKAVPNPIFSIAVPIRDRQGKVTGVLAGVIDLKQPNFLDKIARSRYGKSGYYLLEDQKTRVIITSSDKRRILQPQASPGVNWLVDRHLQGYEESGIVKNAAGVEVLASAKRVPIANWVMVAAIPTSEAFAPIKDLQSRIMLSATLMTLILGSLVWLLLWRELSPVFSTIKKLADLSVSDTHNVVLPETHHGEIGELIKAFNHLLSALNDRESALTESEFRWKFATEGSGDGLWDWDVTNNKVFFSSNWKKMLGYSDDEISNSLDEWKRLVHPDDWEGTIAKVQQHLEGKTPTYSSEHRLLCKDTKYKWILDRGLVVSRDEHGKPLRAIGTHTDITERKHMEELIRQQALYDSLTKLPNRRLLFDRLTLAMSVSKRTGYHGAVLFLDLDNFKPLNDTHGHEAGDLLLIEVANRLKHCVRESDTVARMGGDEFVVVLAQLDKNINKSKQQAATLAEKVRAVLAKPYLIQIEENGKNIMVEHHCTASIGFVLFLDEQSNINDILRNADDAMYQAKNAGRDLVRLYNEDNKHSEDNKV